MRFSMKKHEELVLRVLDQWTGTPEELGELLHDATMQLSYGKYYSDEFKRNERERRVTARRRLREFEGGQELIDMEMAFNRTS